MSDIVERLRTEAPSYVLIGEAAIEIERLRKVLHSIAKEYDGKAVAEVARAALEGK